MKNQKVYRAIGLMSGTSLDGIDVALIETDGFAYVKPLDFKTVIYTDEDRAILRSVLGRRDYDEDVRAAEKLLTDLHVAALRDFGHEADVIGFHGQTLFHDPAQGTTFQIGDAAFLACQMAADVVGDFRKNDVMAGGHGAPFLPLYHRARAVMDGLGLPVCVLNIGGVSNVTFIGDVADENQIQAFDCGPGNALLDDFVFQRSGKKYDKNGNLAKNGQLYKVLLSTWMAHDYFDVPVPKSLDRDAWDVHEVGALSLEDGAATLSAFTVEAVARARDFLPQDMVQSVRWFVCGGGRHNDFLMESLRARLDADVMPVEVLGWNGDALEAEGFAYLAVRSLLGEPLSLPATTGVPAPQTGGVLFRACA